MSDAEHGLSCGRCGARLLPGGTPGQQPHRLLIAGREPTAADQLEGQPPSEWPVYELVCLACWGLAA